LWDLKVNFVLSLSVTHPALEMLAGSIVRDSGSMSDRPEGDSALATGIEQRYRGNSQSSARCHRS